MITKVQKALMASEILKRIVRKDERRVYNFLAKCSIKRNHRLKIFPTIHKKKCEWRQRKWKRDSNVLRWQSSETIWWENAGYKIGENISERFRGLRSKVIHLIIARFIRNGPFAKTRYSCQNQSSWYLIFVIWGTAGVLSWSSPNLNLGKLQFGQVPVLLCRFWWLLKHPCRHSLWLHVSP